MTRERRGPARWVAAELFEQARTLTNAAVALRRRRLPESYTKASIAGASAMLDAARVLRDAGNAMWNTP